MTAIGATILVVERFLNSVAASQCEAGARAAFARLAHGNWLDKGP
jgi:hypothetical protein